MKILLINDHIHPVGGAEILIHSFYESLRQKGHEVRIFTSNALRETADAEYVCFGSTSFYNPLVQSANFLAAQKLKQALKEFQPDIVHIQLFLTQLSPLILPLLKKIPTVYYAVWYRAICPIGTKLLPDGQVCKQQKGKACLANKCLPLRDWLPLMGQLKLLNRWKGVFNKIVVPSQAVKNNLVANNFQVDEIIEHGIKPRPATTFDKNEHPTIAFCGRLVKGKGAHILLAAFQKVLQYIPSAKLFIIGDGPEKIALVQQANDLNITKQTTFYGFLPFKESESRLGNAWIQVIPSVWEEPFGLVAIDAMFRGTSIIASNKGGLGEFIQDKETGILVKSGEKEDLSTAIIQLLNDKASRSAIERKALKLATKKLTINNFTNQFLKLYKEILL